MLLDVGGAVGGLAAGERLVRTADLIVLVVVADTTVEDLRNALAVLEQFGSRVDWALFVARSAAPERRGLTAPPRVSTPPTIAPAPTPAPELPARTNRWTPTTVSRVERPARRAGGGE